jgi:hypothetical protein
VEDYPGSTWAAKARQELFGSQSLPFSEVTRNRSARDERAFCSRDLHIWISLRHSRTQIAWHNAVIWWDRRLAVAVHRRERRRSSHRAERWSLEACETSICFHAVPSVPVHLHLVSLGKMRVRHLRGKHEQAQPRAIICFDAGNDDESSCAPSLCPVVCRSCRDTDRPLTL